MPSYGCLNPASEANLAWEGLRENSDGNEKGLGKVEALFCFVLRRVMSNGCCVVVQP